MLPNEPVQSPMKPEPGGDQELVKRQLVSLLQQAKKVAEANGIDFNEVMSEMNGKTVSASATMPRPPMGGPMSQDGGPPGPPML
jgi:hypothetical protein